MSWLGEACDCHVHIIGPVKAYPQVSVRTYTAAPAPLDALRCAATAAGVARFVIVQPSFYGTDNSCTLAALKALGDRGRGVAVLDPESANAAMVRTFDAAGVRGLRLNLYSTISQREGRDLRSALAPTLRLAAEVGWHVQLIAPLPALLEAAPLIAAAPVPVVFDHYALFGDADPSDPDGKRMLRLLSAPHLWVKLSAPYRVSIGPLATHPPATWLAAMLDAAPDRCIWGSDWPHTAPHADQSGHQRMLPHRDMDYPRVLGDFVAALPDEGCTRRVLVDNPQRLYGFP